MPSADSLLGLALLVFATVVFVYYTAWVRASPVASLSRRPCFSTVSEDAPTPATSPDAAMGCAGDDPSLCRRRPAAPQLLPRQILRRRHPRLRRRGKLIVVVGRSFNSINDTSLSLPCSFQTAAAAVGIFLARTLSKNKKKVRRLLPPGV